MGRVATPVGEDGEDLMLKEATNLLGTDEHALGHVLKGVPLTVRGQCSEGSAEVSAVERLVAGEEGRLEFDQRGVRGTRQSRRDREDAPSESRKSAREAL